MYLSIGLDNAIQTKSCIVTIIGKQQTKQDIFSKILLHIFLLCRIREAVGTFVIYVD